MPPAAAAFRAACGHENGVRIRLWRRLGRQEDARSHEYTTIVNELPVSSDDACASPDRIVYSISAQTGAACMSKRWPAGSD